MRALLDELAGADGRRRIDLTAPEPPPLFSLSLNVAQTCNMSCGYCYADRGKFGGAARLMPFDVAVASVDRLIAQSAPGADLVLGFIGGEPLINRKLVHSITDYAAEKAQPLGSADALLDHDQRHAGRAPGCPSLPGSWFSRRGQPRWRRRCERRAATQCATAADRTRR